MADWPLKHDGSCACRFVRKEEFGDVKQTEWCGFHAKQKEALAWKKIIPTTNDLDGNSEEYYWVRGGNFNRMVMVRANNGMYSEMVDGKRQFRPEVNFDFHCENCPPHIWAHELANHAGLSSLEWAGPVQRPNKDKVIING